MGYLGVLGIDYIYANGKLYFIEINPRFQSSTQQLDYLLKKSSLSSIFDYNYRAFKDKEMPGTKNMLLSVFS
ncbi:MAG: ATP-grasp domain-containing protein [Oscillospiraceae bacterium]|jgi:predicted ATP-grasp superfamily ATP-dependent carboligase|nr:ATP-grasp domain-containing protein [Oscillospiraceae bacterium]